jgi:hypothetical protein
MLGRCEAGSASVVKFIASMGVAENLQILDMSDCGGTASCYYDHSRNNFIIILCLCNSANSCI